MSVAPSAGVAPTIRLAKLSGGDPEAYARHIVEHMAESGRGGSPHFALARVWSVEEVRAAFAERLSRSLDEPLWGRAWLLFDERRVVGHLELRGGRVPAEMHRATLGMGLMRAFTARGQGARLVEEAVRWARDEAGLRWIDLGVFATNAPARKLYARMGFVELGVRQDAFRLEAGPIIDDVQMALRLR
jgi:RimJ/RimL family protein N-acetyltransferase